MIAALLALVSLLFTPAPVQASSPGLQLNPLKYEDTITGDNVRSGYIDVANPSDTSVTVKTQVQGFKQANLDGDLEFFLDDPIKQGIVVGLSDFELGPRESVRVPFSVVPKKLPQGGVYAAIFFRTVPPDQSSATSYVTESANVGTLLLLQNGGEGQHIGRISQFDLPFFQFGRGLHGSAQYENTNRTTAPIAFSPGLATRVFPWGRTAKFTGPFVLPGSTRQFTLDRPGSYLGLLPVTLIDTASGKGATRWVLACTGAYAWGALVLAVLVLVFAATRRLRRRKPAPAHPTRRPLDSLGPRSK